MIFRIVMFGVFSDMYRIIYTQYRGASAKYKNPLMDRTLTFTYEMSTIHTFALSFFLLKGIKLSEKNCVYT